MNFDFSEEQALLRATVERFGQERHGHDVEKRRASRAKPGGFDRDGWRALAGLGVLGLPFAEPLGGLGGGPADLIAVALPLGQWLATEPFTESLLAAGTLVEAGGDGAMLAQLMSGEAVAAAALGERGGRYNLFHVETRATRRGGQWQLSGAKSAVWQGGAADLFLVSARVAGDVRDPHDIMLFQVPADAVERQVWRAADGSLAAEILLREAPGTPLEADAGEAIELMVQRVWLAASAEMLGIAQTLFDMTLAYVKTRVQFGRPIGQFQVIQHRLTDAYVALEQARSLLLRAAALGDDPRALAAARAYMGEAALKVAHEAVQFHGGMGVTDELLIGHGLKRLQLLARLFGDQDCALQRFAEAA